jgi:hypothetical protein
MAKTTNPDSVAITTILEATQPEERVKALEAWRERITETQAEAILQAGIERGKYIHSLCEDYFNHGCYIDKPGAKRLERFFDRLQWKYVELEVENEQEGYHGKLDWLGSIADPERSGEMRRCVIDWKGTDKDPKKVNLYDGPLQLGAYSRCDGVHVDLAGLIYVNPKTWQIQPYWFGYDDLKHYYVEFLKRKDEYHSRNRK